MKPLNSEEMVVVMDIICQGLIIAFDIKESDLADPEVKSKLLTNLVELIRLDSAVTDGKIKQHLAPQAEEDSVKLINRNGRDWALINGGKDPKSKSHLTLV